MKEQAAALHRAGEYEEAAEEFARAAAVLETAGGVLAPPPALDAIRLSLAASQLKVRRRMRLNSGRCIMLFGQVLVHRAVRLEAAATRKGGGVS